MTRLKELVLVSSLVLLGSVDFAEAAEVSDTWLNLGGVSYHTDRSIPMNEVNYGIGLRKDLTETTFLSVGAYKNSIHKTSKYVVFGKSLIAYKQLSAGFVGGVIDGYNINNGGTFPMAAPYVSYETDSIGVDVVYIPKVDENVSAVFGLQVRVKL